MSPEELDPNLLDEAAIAAAEPQESESLDEENRLKPEFVRKVRDALEADERDAVYDLVEPLHPADIADLFELLPHDERPDFARAISDLMGAEVFAELNDWVRELIVENLPAETVADIAEQLDTDDAVAMIEDLDEEDQQAVLAEMEPEDRAAIESALSYPEETAGRLMSRDFIAVPEHMSVGDLIDYLRENQNLANEFWEVFIVDARHHPVGTCALSWILRTPRGIALAADKPVVGVTTLTAYAAPIVSQNAEHPVISAIDARHDHVYFQVVSGSGGSLIRPRVAPIDATNRDCDRERGFMKADATSLLK